MAVEALERWVGTAGPEPEPRLHHRFLEPPYGYVLGISIWPLFLLSLSAWAVLLQADLPSVAVTVGSLVVVGGSLLAILSSALVLSITAWNTPYERLRRQFVPLVLSLGLAVLLFGAYLTWPTFPYGDELGVSIFVAHELSKVVFVGPAIGFSFALFPLMIFASRYRLE
ncbi:hypothetical protein [Halorussus halobius]|uniref:hypothetical protein n=1 Tax=Halorussus halobius TaxID=1710537 RepID=UPI001092A18A|nr:hypothetical protein [Halorussus halobius]